jgi:hypothetical protein
MLYRPNEISVWRELIEVVFAALAVTAFILVIWQAIYSFWPGAAEFMNRMMDCGAPGCF